MAQEAVIEKTKDVMLDKLDALNEYAVYRAESEHNGRGYLGDAGGSTIAIDFAAGGGDSAYLCSMPDVKQSIIDGMNTPVNECVTDVGL